jgi:transcription elongation factor Elf1
MPEIDRPRCWNCGRQVTIRCPIGLHQAVCKNCGLRAPWELNRQAALDQWNRIAEKMNKPLDERV